MILKIVAVAALLALPFSAVVWYRSHQEAFFHRYDLTLYKSLWVYLKDGRCGLEMLSMPNKVASRSEFHAPLEYDPLAGRGFVQLHSYSHGRYRTTWFVFPLWLPTIGLLLLSALPLASRPVRRWWRHRRGLCIECGYNLTGLRSDRCPECGESTK